MTTEEQISELRAKIASLENRIYWLEMGRKTETPMYPPQHVPPKPPWQPPYVVETITGHLLP